MGFGIRPWDCELGFGIGNWYLGIKMGQELLIMMTRISDWELETKISYWRLALVFGY